LAQRSRKRRAGGRAGTASASSPTPPTPPSASAAPRPSRSERTELRNAEARAALTPLGEGERPGAVTVAAFVALALAALVLIGYASGARVGGKGSLGAALVFAAVLIVAAGGMWRARYWAVLGFEALLAFQIVIAALSLLVASNLWALLICLAVIGFGGWLFWKLIRAMARIQMPERRPVP
jgi:hypothetical protein